MVKILFVCHGNICRSPDGGVCDEGPGAAGRGARGGTRLPRLRRAAREIGNPVYPPAQRKLAEHGIGCAGKTARRLTRADYAAWDLLIGMDEENLYNMRRLCGGDPAGKMHLLLEYAHRPGEVADPWYTGDLRPPGVTSWTAAAACWPPWKRKNKRRPRCTVPQIKTSPPACPHCLSPRRGERQRSFSGYLRRRRRRSGVSGNHPFHLRLPFAVAL